jgi:hypothetical protein
MVDVVICLKKKEKREKMEAATAAVAAVNIYSQENTVKFGVDASTVVKCRIESRPVVK